MKLVGLLFLCLYSLSLMALASEGGETLEWSARFFSVETQVKEHSLDQQRQMPRDGLKVRAKDKVEKLQGPKSWKDLNLEEAFPEEYSSLYSGVVHLAQSNKIQCYRNQIDLRVNPQSLNGKPLTLRFANTWPRLDLLLGVWVRPEDAVSRGIGVEPREAARSGLQVYFEPGQRVGAISRGTLQELEDFQGNRRSMRYVNYQNMNQYFAMLYGILLSEKTQTPVDAEFAKEWTKIYKDLDKVLACCLNALCKKNAIDNPPTPLSDGDKRKADATP